MDLIIKKALLSRNWLWNDFAKYQDYLKSYVGPQIESFHAHCVHFTIWLVWTLISTLKAHYKVDCLRYSSSSSDKEITMSLSVLRRSYTSPISIFVAFLNRSHQADVICITIYLKLLMIDRETNQQSSTGSSVGLELWGHAEPGSNSDGICLLLHSFRLK